MKVLYLLYLDYTQLAKHKIVHDCLCRKLVQRAERLGYKAIFLTVDLPHPGKREKVRYVALRSGCSPAHEFAFEVPGEHF